MTNTEAIKVLNSYCSERYLADTSLQEACSVAVEALQVQAESEDAISRQAVKDLFCRICMESNLCYRSKETCEDLKLFDKLPSVKPQEKTVSFCDTCKYGGWYRHGWTIDMADDKCGGCCAFNDKYEPQESEEKA